MLIMLVFPLSFAKAYYSAYDVFFSQALIQRMRGTCLQIYYVRI